MQAIDVLCAAWVSMGSTPRFDMLIFVSVIFLLNSKALFQSIVNSYGLRGCLFQSCFFFLRCFVCAEGLVSFCAAVNDVNKWLVCHGSRYMVEGAAFMHCSRLCPPVIAQNSRKRWGVSLPVPPLWAIQLVNWKREKGHAEPYPVLKSNTR